MNQKENLEYYSNQFESNDTLESANQKKKLNEQFPSVVHSLIPQESEETNSINGNEKLLQKAKMQERNAISGDQDKQKEDPCAVDHEQTSQGNITIKSMDKHEEILKKQFKMRDSNAINDDQDKKIENSNAVGHEQTLQGNEKTNPKNQNDEVLAEQFEMKNSNAINVDQDKQIENFSVVAHEQTLQKNEKKESIKENEMLKEQIEMQDNNAISCDQEKQNENPSTVAHEQTSQGNEKTNTINQNDEVLEEQFRMQNSNAINIDQDKQIENSSAVAHEQTSQKNEKKESIKENEVLKKQIEMQDNNAISYDQEKQNENPSTVAHEQTSEGNEKTNTINQNDEVMEEQFGMQNNYAINVDQDKQIENSSAVAHEQTSQKNEKKESIKENEVLKEQIEMQDNNAISCDQEKQNENPSTVAHKQTSQGNEKTNTINQSDEVLEEQFGMQNSNAINVDQDKQIENSSAVAHEQTWQKNEKKESIKENEVLKEQIEMQDSNTISCDQEKQNENPSTVAHEETSQGNEKTNPINQNDEVSEEQFETQDNNAINDNKDKESENFGNVAHELTSQGNEKIKSVTQNEEMLEEQFEMLDSNVINSDQDKERENSKTVAYELTLQGKEKINSINKNDKMLEDQFEMQDINAIIDYNYKQREKSGLEVHEQIDKGNEKTNFFNKNEKMLEKQFEMQDSNTINDDQDKQIENSSVEGDEQTSQKKEKKESIKVNEEVLKKQIEMQDNNAINGDQEKQNENPSTVAQEQSSQGNVKTNPINQNDEVSEEQFEMQDSNPMNVDQDKASEIPSIVAHEIILVWFLLNQFNELLEEFKKDLSNAINKGLVQGSKNSSNVVHELTYKGMEKSNLINLNDKMLKEQFRLLENNAIKDNKDKESENSGNVVYELTSQGKEKTNSINQNDKMLEKQFEIQDNKFINSDQVQQNENHSNLVHELTYQGNKKINSINQNVEMLEEQFEMQESSAINGDQDKKSENPSAEAHELTSQSREKTNSINQNYEILKEKFKIQDINATKDDQDKETENHSNVVHELTYQVNKKTNSINLNNEMLEEQFGTENGNAINDDQDNESEYSKTEAHELSFQKKLLNKIEELLEKFKMQESNAIKDGQDELLRSEEPISIGHQLILQGNRVTNSRIRKEDILEKKLKIQDKNFINDDQDVFMQNEESKALTHKLISQGYKETNSINQNEEILKKQFEKPVVSVDQYDFKQNKESCFVEHELSFQENEETKPRNKNKELLKKHFEIPVRTVQSVNASNNVRRPFHSESVFSQKEETCHCKHENEKEMGRMNNSLLLSIHTQFYNREVMKERYRLSSGQNFATYEHLLSENVSNTKTMFRAIEESKNCELKLLKQYKFTVSECETNQLLEEINGPDQDSMTSSSNSYESMNNFHFLSDEKITEIKIPRKNEEDSFPIFKINVFQNLAAEKNNLSLNNHLRTEEKIFGGADYDKNDETYVRVNQEIVNETKNGALIESKIGEDTMVCRSEISQKTLSEPIKNNLERSHFIECANSDNVSITKSDITSLDNLQGTDSSKQNFISPCGQFSILSENHISNETPKSSVEDSLSINELDFRRNDIVSANLPAADIVEKFNSSVSKSEISLIQSIRYRTNPLSDRNNTVLDGKNVKESEEQNTIDIHVPELSNQPQNDAIIENGASINKENSSNKNIEGCEKVNIYFHDEICKPELNDSSKKYEEKLHNDEKKFQNYAPELTKTPETESEFSNQPQNDAVIQNGASMQKKDSSNNIIEGWEKVNIYFHDEFSRPELCDSSKRCEEKLHNDKKNFQIYIPESTKTSETSSKQSNVTIKNMTENMPPSENRITDVEQKLPISSTEICSKGKKCVKNDFPKNDDESNKDLVKKFHKSCSSSKRLGKKRHRKIVSSTDKIDDNPSNIVSYPQKLVGSECSLLLVNILKTKECSVFGKEQLNHTMSKEGVSDQDHGSSEKFLSSTHKTIVPDTEKERTLQKFLVESNYHDSKTEEQGGIHVCKINMEDTLRFTPSASMSFLERYNNTQEEDVTTREQDVIRAKQIFPATSNSFYHKNNEATLIANQDNHSEQSDVSDEFKTPVKYEWGEATHPERQQNLKWISDVDVVRVAEQGTETSPNHELIRRKMSREYEGAPIQYNLHYDNLDLEFLNDPSSVTIALNSLSNEEKDGKNMVKPISLKSNKKAKRMSEGSSLLNFDVPVLSVKPERIKKTKLLEPKLPFPSKFKHRNANYFFEIQCQRENDGKGIKVFHPTHDSPSHIEKQLIETFNSSITVPGGNENIEEDIDIDSLSECLSQLSVTEDKNSKDSTKMNDFSFKTKDFTLNLHSKPNSSRMMFSYEQTATNSSLIVRSESKEFFFETAED